MSRRQGRNSLWLVALLLGPAGIVTSAESKSADDGKVIELPVFRVKGDLLEDFGFRVSPVLDPHRLIKLLPGYSPVVDLILPNTAASKAGIRLGDRIITADGQPTGSATRELRRWKDIQRKKWAEPPDALQRVGWTLEVESVWGGETRTIFLVLPTPAPHWGATVWQAPEGRTPAVVTEPGPLAARAKEILDNGIGMILRETYQRGFQLPVDAANPFFLSYQWTLWDENGGHRIFVSQQRGRTDIIFEAITRTEGERPAGGKGGRTPDATLAAATTTLATRAKAYLTSPVGGLIAAMDLYPPKEIAPGDAREGFNAEVDFWLNKVGKTSPLWPLGVLGQGKK